MYNGKEIKKALKDATKLPKKPNPYKHDVITDLAGQWKYPGQVTKVPSGDITMQGVPYPVFGVDNLGNSQMMYPGANYTFPGQSVTEYPIIKSGGWLDKYVTGGPSPEKAKAMLENGSAYGHPLTDAQIRLFESIVAESEEEEEPEEEFRKGGSKRKLPRSKTSKNIQSSINFLMARNPMLYGLPGYRLYDPDTKMINGGWLDKYK
jgi:hypothetical protein